MSVNILDSNRHLKSIAGGDIPIATNLNAGKVKPDGTTINVDQSGTISVNEFVGTTAEVEQALSGLEDGTTIYITDDNEGGGNVPIATTTTPGIVKPDGTSITVAQDGTITATAQSPSIATTTTAGIVKPDGSTITVAQDGTITSSVPVANTTRIGGFKQNYVDYWKNGYYEINSNNQLKIDSYNFGFNRWNLFPNGLTDTVINISGGDISAGSSSSNVNLYTFTDPGIYIVNINGWIKTTGSGNALYTGQIILDDGTSTYKTICKTQATAYSDGFWAGLGMYGIVIANTNNKIGIAESVTVTAIKGLNGELRIKQLYSFNAPLTGPNWWQQQTIS